MRAAIILRVYVAGAQRRCQHKSLCHYQVSGRIPVHTFELGGGGCGCAPGCATWGSAAHFARTALPLAGDGKRTGWIEEWSSFVDAGVSLCTLLEEPVREEGVAVVCVRTGMVVGMAAGVVIGEILGALGDMLLQANSRHESNRVGVDGRNRGNGTQQQHTQTTTKRLNKFSGVGAPSCNSNVCRRAVRWVLSRCFFLF